MNKNIIIFSISFLLSPFSFSQAPGIEWQNTIGGLSSDDTYASNGTSDGGYIIGSRTYSGIGGDKTEPSVGIDDYWILKLDALGNIEWQNTIGSVLNDVLFSISQTLDGGYIIGGRSSFGISGDKTVEGNGNTDMWIIKLDSIGNIQWQNSIGTSVTDYFTQISQTADGGYIVGGYTDGGPSADKSQPSNGGDDYWVLKLDNAGNIIWEKGFGGADDDRLFDVEQTFDGGYILGGYSFSNISGDKSEDNLGWTDFWVIKINSVGDLEWENTIGGLEGDYLFSLHQTADEGYILAGETGSGISGDKTSPIHGLNDYWVIKINSSGTIIWQTNLGGFNLDYCKSIEKTFDGGCIVSGYSSSGIGGEKTEASYGSSDYWVIKLDATGNIQWQKTIGGTSSDFLYNSIQASDGGYALIGYSFSGIGGIKTEASLSGDIWIVKLFPDCSPTPELCNTLDDNCNGIIDDGIIETITISAAGPTTFCQGGSVLLNSIYSGTTIQWKKDGVNIPGATSSTYNVTKKATYTATTTSPCGTVTSAGIYVNVQKNPLANITAGGATTFCAGGSVILTANSGAGLSYQWYKGASLIAGGTSINYTATTAGNYKCRVTKTATGCYKNSNVIAVTVPCKEGEELLGDINSSFSIYPNPNNGTFTLSASSAALRSLRETDACLLDIYNSLGQLIYSKQIYSIDGNINETISVRNIATGIYIVKLSNGNLQNAPHNYSKQKLIIEIY